MNAAIAPTILDRTLSGLEEGLHVGLITTWEPDFCRPGDPAAPVGERLRAEDHERMPVCDADDRLVGIVDRADCSSDEHSIGKIMAPLTGDMVIPEHLPIEEFIEIAGDEAFRLVIRRDRKIGIVTRSDLHKLPVRLVVFALITHLEQLMIQIIEQESGGDVQWWWDALDHGRQNRILRLEDSQKQDGMNPDRLQLTQLWEKGDIIALKLDPDPEFDKQISEISDLRNALAHSGEYAGNDGDMKEFVKRVRWTRNWIMWCYRQILPSSSGPQS